MAEDQKANPDEPKKKSKMMLFIVLGLALLLAGGGGFFAFTTLIPSPDKTPQQPQEGDDAIGVGEMVTFGEFVVNLSDPKGKRYLKCKISVEVETIEAVDRLKKIEPKLRDIVIMLLTSLAFEEVMTPEGKIRIRDELLERFNQAARPDRVRNLYFSDFVVQ
jgi:flagellar FliL protein